MTNKTIIDLGFVSSEQLWRSWSVLYAKKTNKQTNKSICLDPETFSLSG